MRLSDECDIVDTDRYAGSIQYRYFTFLLKYMSVQFYVSSAVLL